MGFAGKRFQSEETAFARRATGAGTLRRGIFFRDGVPLAARLAFALPTPVGGAAILADEQQRPFGHTYPPLKTR
jgi:hypothetical protein